MRLQNEVIYSDQNVIIVNKPAGVLSVPDRYNSSLRNVYSWITGIYDDARPVHRLDRYTSGILCFARGQQAFKHFSEAFEKRTVQKYYHAIVLGVPSSNASFIDKSLEKLNRQNQVIISKRGKAAQTNYTVLETYGSFALLHLQILTGRTHQIRVHLQSIGHPLLVDPVYGGKDEFLLSEIKPTYKKRDQERPLLKRTPLHASKIVLPLPDGNSLTIEAPLPKDMRAVIRQMQLLKG
ncbi:MAG: RluA family pseudouridine synthase [Saprospiraceae bacterium]|nr:RluA family pseudouridine synthase [Saprospiraceae bacterium]